MGDLSTAIGDMVAAFEAYESAIKRAQRMYHNYQEWDSEQWQPIEDARAAFYDASEEAKASALRVGEESR